MTDRDCYSATGTARRSVAGGDRGSATAELAAGLPALMLLLLSTVQVPPVWRTISLVL